MKMLFTSVKKKIFCYVFKVNEHVKYIEKNLLILVDDYFALKVHDYSRYEK
jgi:hypothetical protein